MQYDLLLDTVALSASAACHMQQVLLNTHPFTSKMFQFLAPVVIKVNSV